MKTDSARQNQYMYLVLAENIYIQHIEIITAWPEIALELTL